MCECTPLPFPFLFYHYLSLEIHPKAVSLKEAVSGIANDPLTFISQGGVAKCANNVDVAWPRLVLGSRGCASTLV